MCGCVKCFSIYTKFANNFVYKIFGRFVMILCKQKYVLYCRIYHYTDLKKFFWLGL